MGYISFSGSLHKSKISDTSQYNLENKHKKFALANKTFRRIQIVIYMSLIAFRWSTIYLALMNSRNWKLEIVEFKVHQATHGSIPVNRNLFRSHLFALLAHCECNHSDPIFTNDNNSNRTTRKLTDRMRSEFLIIFDGNDFSMETLFDLTNISNELYNVKRSTICRPATFEAGFQTV